MCYSPLERAPMRSAKHPHRHEITTLRPSLPQSGRASTGTCRTLAFCATRVAKRVRYTLRQAGAIRGEDPGFLLSSARMPPQVPEHRHCDGDRLPHILPAEGSPCVSASDAAYSIRSSPPVNQGLIAVLSDQCRREPGTSGGSLAGEQHGGRGNL